MKTRHEGFSLKASRSFLNPISSTLLIALAFTLSSLETVVAANTSLHIHDRDPRESSNLTPALASLADLEKLNIPIHAKDEVSQVGLAILSEDMKFKLQELSHAQGKCGGFEALPEDESFINSLHELRNITLRTKNWQRIPWHPMQSKEPQSAIVDALAMIQETNLHETVTWLSSFKNRNEKDPKGSEHIYQMKLQIEQMLQSYPSPWSVDIISHNRTKQKSLRVRLEGKSRPQEVIVMGGHHDSINHSWSGDRTLAPGADDNASGSANLLEIVRVLSDQNPLDRTVEIIWYAGEESGLLGSAEIAKEYKQSNIDVVAVLQLDMTLYPGTGEMTISNITDFTNPWLQEFLKQINEVYVGLKILDDKCGYGCSDHASWHRQGFPAVIPFEALSSQMNPKIHTAKDVISPALSFKHSAAIAKLALAFAMELGNSEIRPPK